MERKRVLFYSIISGLLGVILVGIYVYRLESKLGSDIAGNTGRLKVAVVIATEDIPAGTLIRDGMVKVKEINETSALPMAMSCREEVVGQVAVEEIIKGSQVTVYRINNKRANLSSKIPGKGIRALSLPVIGVNGLSGLLHPGNRVDILGTFKGNLSGSYSGPTTCTLLQNVQVLAVGRSINKKLEEEHYSSVTVAVTPDESEILSLAINSGTIITLTLRSGEDNDILELKKKKFNEIFNLKTSLNKKRKEYMKSIEVIRSTNKETERVK